jgi:hypothetical protein
MLAPPLVLAKTRSSSTRVNAGVKAGARLSLRVNGWILNGALRTGQQQTCRRYGPFGACELIKGQAVMNGFTASPTGQMGQLLNPGPWKSAIPAPMGAGISA